MIQYNFCLKHLLKTLIIFSVLGGTICIIPTSLSLDVNNINDNKTTISKNIFIANTNINKNHQIDVPFHCEWSTLKQSNFKQISVNLFNGYATHITQILFFIFKHVQLLITAIFQTRKRRTVVIYQSILFIPPIFKRIIVFSCFFNEKVCEILRHLYRFQWMGYIFSFDELELIFFRVELNAVKRIQLRFKSWYELQVILILV